MLPALGGNPHLLPALLILIVAAFIQLAEHIARSISVFGHNLRAQTLQLGLQEQSHQADTVLSHTTIGWSLLQTLIQSRFDPLHIVWPQIVAVHHRED